MKRNDGENSALKPLAYRLRKTVTSCERDGSVVLTLGFPLKVLVLDLVWGPVLSRLSQGDFVPLEEIAPLIDAVDLLKTEGFLDDLVRKGFLDREGFSVLREYPLVSIIIPVRNRPEEIQACLESLGRLRYPASKLETIVVDDASTDNTPEVISEFPVNLTVLKTHKQASYCRNLGARSARGEILAFIDSDCRADPLWLKELVPAFMAADLAAVGGLVESHFQKKALDRYERVKSALSMGAWFKRSMEEEPFFYVPSCNLLVRREPFLRMDGFNEAVHVGEDVDFCWRLQDAGYHFEYRPMGRVAHRHRNRIGTFCIRRFEYGTSEPLLQKIHPRRMKTMWLPTGETLFWAAAVAGIVTGFVPVLLLSGACLLADFIVRFNRIRLRHIPIKAHRLALAVSRSYLAFFYHSSAFVSRYYLLWSVLTFPLWPKAAAVMFGMHGLTGLVQFFIKKPDLNPLSFLFYFSLEQISYQAGVWWGCIGNFCFRPVNPQLSVRPIWNKQNVDSFRR